jgi:amidohydrolase
MIEYDENRAAAYLKVLRPYAQEVEAELVGVSRDIHARPEIRFEEHFASELLARTLAEKGFDVRRDVGGMRTAFVASYGEDAGEGPTLAVFCEYDALDGLGHACGHNIIAAAGLGAAVVVARWLADNPGVPGRLVVFGSPGEEGGGGKVFLADAGLLDGIDVAMMIHPSGENIGHRPTMARTKLEIAFEGRAAHAATSPHEGVNALDAANLTLVAIGLLRQQLRADSRIHAIVVDGGQEPNIIPERASLRAYVRSPEAEYLRCRLVPAVTACVQGAALATGATARIEVPSPDYLDIRGNDALVRLSEANLAALGRTVSRECEMSGSTDMGNISHLVPSVHPYIELSPGLVMHTRQAADEAASPSGDRAVVDGALELAMTAVALYSEPALLAAVLDDFPRHRDP